MRFMVSRAGTRRCYVYISLLCVGVKKRRKISSERVFCAFEKNLRFVSNATFTTKNDKEFEEKDSREMRALLLCVAVHKSSSSSI